jgi:tRNA(Ile)-lysidine synthase
VTQPLPDNPLTPAEIDALFAPLAGRSLLVGWSGGPDSTALVGLLASWARTDRVRLATATIDHGLRDGSRREAEWVRQQALAHAVDHVVLDWAGPKPATGVQEAARKARYQLLAQEARRIGADTLVTAHTLDDQAETILMRLSRGSGLDGLRGMRTISRREGLDLIRPLLGTSKSRLVTTCNARGWQFVTDPLNDDPRFARARWRSLMPLLAREGLTPERLARFGERAGAAQDAIRWEVRRSQVPAYDGKAPERVSYPMADLAEKPTPYLVCFLLDIFERHAPDSATRTLRGPREAPPRGDPR